MGDERHSVCCKAIRDAKVDRRGIHMRIMAAAYILRQMQMRDTGATFSLEGDYGGVPVLLAFSRKVSAMLAISQHELCTKMSRAAQRMML